MSGAHVFIDRSQFPEKVQLDLLESLRTRAINHKFHYDSYKQAAKWLALHEAYSLARNDPGCMQIYGDAFRSMVNAAENDGRRVHVLGLGCGGGQKESQLLGMLTNAGLDAGYTAADVSLPLVLTARLAAMPFLKERRCRAVVCDLATTDLPALFKERQNSARRIVTLFGIVPNFKPAALLSQIGRFLWPNDLFLVSANLAPGVDYARGVRAIVPQYDNELTRDWLLTFLFDLGFQREDGELKFTVEIDEQKLLRITAHFELKQSREIRVLGQSFCFNRDERIRLFFSYRHTPQTIRSAMGQHGIIVESEWLNDTGEEGVFLCRKSP